MASIDEFMNNLYDKLPNGVHMSENVYYLDFSYNQVLNKSDIGRFISDYKSYEVIYPTFFIDFNKTHSDYCLGYITNHSCSENLDSTNNDRSYFTYISWHINFRIVYKKLQ